MTFIYNIQIIITLWTIFFQLSRPKIYPKNENDVELWRRIIVLCYNTIHYGYLYLDLGEITAKNNCVELFISDQGGSYIC